jgi:hypothetical protein
MGYPMLAFLRPLVEQIEALPRPWGYFALLVPLVVAISLVYKGAKFDGTAVVAAQTLRLTGTILLGMGIVAVTLVGLIRYFS